ncbi:MarR family winged helix-turn-helix transcriptional regulator [Rhodoferax saidenbachensis]|uniref:DNA-binding MarR family transcriptional regulator n=1 Tax=Rhodoferax saidenbachensis TaxID=1484693 RepID=A0ABU1ZR40_9BURK|nr:MarR family winged helix-turn-helix transcriptional regulator [Rhodoferax saidenbachensis]MDR7308008.1 DNA-binding MarR family transcriptional regulator [Rhodoferax saidenbachensis]
MKTLVKPIAVADVLKPQGCTNLKLRQLMRRVAQYYDAELAKTGLKTTQYSLLSHVVKLGPIRAVDLAGAMRMSTSTLSRNLQPLIAAGWIEVNAGDDARSRLITATDAGQTKRTEAQRKWRIAQEGINATLGIARVSALHALIDESLELLSPLESGDDDV